MTDANRYREADPSTHLSQKSESSSISTVNPEIHVEQEDVRSSEMEQQHNYTSMDPKNMEARVQIPLSPSLNGQSEQQQTSVSLDDPIQFTRVSSSSVLTNSSSNDSTSELPSTSMNGRKEVLGVVSPTTANSTPKTISNINGSSNITPTYQDSQELSTIGDNTNSTIRISSSDKNINSTLNDTFTTTDSTYDLTEMQQPGSMVSTTSESKYGIRSSTPVTSNSVGLPKHIPKFNTTTKISTIPNMKTARPVIKPSGSSNNSSKAQLSSSIASSSKTSSTTSFQSYDGKTKGSSNSSLMKGVFSSFVQNIKRTSQGEKRKSNSSSVKISTPYNAKHIHHVGIDSKTGEYTGLPEEWEKLLTSSGISKKEQQQNMQTVMDIVRFYQDVSESTGEDKVFKTFNIEGSDKTKSSSSPSLRSNSNSTVNKSENIVTPTLGYDSPRQGFSAFETPSRTSNLSSPKRDVSTASTTGSMSSQSANVANGKFIPSRPAPRPPGKQGSQGSPFITQSSSVSTTPIGTPISGRHSTSRTPSRQTTLKKEEQPLPPLPQKQQNEPHIPPIPRTDARMTNNNNISREASF